MLYLARVANSDARYVLLHGAVTASTTIRAAVRSLASGPSIRDWTMVRAGAAAGLTEDRP
ncbi:hypothetical protein [Streptomyces sp. NPDC058545]|uniref:hypothetical protein n=1 Tax=Streptomyces sp. NPDC058545 TaxID=3346544 RepID=UPI0036623AEA